ncbi:hypothetical protein ABH945_003226 [Paraburkholderia sp. GAS333]
MNPSQVREAGSSITAEAKFAFVKVFGGPAKAAL